jgi:hypothetical protein
VAQTDVLRHTKVELQRLARRSRAPLEATRGLEPPASSPFREITYRGGLAPALDGYTYPNRALAGHTTPLLPA